MDAMTRYPIMPIGRSSTALTCAGGWRDERDGTGGTVPPTALAPARTAVLSTRNISALSGSARPSAKTLMDSGNLGTRLNVTAVAVILCVLRPVSGCTPGGAPRMVVLLVVLRAVRISHTMSIMTIGIVAGSSCRRARSVCLGRARLSDGNRRGCISYEN